MRITAIAVLLATTTTLFINAQTKPAPPADRPLRTTATRMLVHHAAFAPDNTVVVWDSAGFGKWNFETGKTVDRQPVFAKACATMRTPLLPRSEDGRTIGVSCAGKLFFFDMSTTAARAEWRYDPKLTPTIYTQSPGGPLIAGVEAGSTSVIHLIDAKSGARQGTIQNTQEVEQLSAAASGRFLVAGAVDSVRVWQVPEAQLLHTIPDGTFHALSADDKMLAIARGRDVAIVDVASGKIAQTLSGPVSQLRFSGNGAVLAGWNNQQLTVWDVPGGKTLLTLKSSQLQTVALSADGQYLLAIALELAGAPQTTLGVWKVPPPK